MEYNDIITPQNLYDFMKENIRYGFVNQNHEVFFRENTSEIYYMEQILRNFYLQRPEEVLESKCGICYDQIEFAKDWFKKHNYDVRSYYTNIKNHAILVYKDNNKYNWLERTYKDILGIHAFDTLDELFDFYIYSQKYNGETLIYEYDKVNFGTTFYDFLMDAKRDGKLVLKK